MKNAQWIAETYQIFKLASGTKHVEVKGAERKEYQEDVYNMVMLTYARIGVPISSKEDLMKYPTWWVYKDEEGTPVAFNCFKETPYGKKSGLSGSNMSPEGKKTVVDLLRTKFKKSGFYGEVSHKVEEIALAAGAPVVPAEFAREVLGKDIKILDDGFHYIRNISGVGEVTKIMIGKPKGIPTKSKISSEDDDDFEDRHSHIGCLIMS